jgi:hypothetical protein
MSNKRFESDSLRQRFALPLLAAQAYVRPQGGIR